MTNIHLLIVAVMVGTAFLAGTTNYFLTYDSKLTTRDKWIKYFASILLSTCATLTVPLFLQILSNNILDQLSFKNALIFGGFCILAGFFSKRYLEDLYSKVKNLEKKVDQQEEETKNELLQSAKDTEAINKKVEDLEETIEEIEIDNVPSEIKDAIISNQTFSFAESTVESLIKALLSTKYSLRTISGISKDTNISSERLTAVMEHLKILGFAESKIGSNGKNYWRILKNPIKIYSANYGITGNFVDVSTQIKELISNEVYHGLATQAFFNINDPAPGIVKSLKIHYRFHGREKDINVVEGETFKIE